MPFPGLDNALVTTRGVHRLTQQSSSGARRPGAPRAARRSSIPVGATEVTDITTGNILADVDFNHRSLAGRTEVLHAPELDDLADTDNLVAIQLEKPSKSTIDPDDVITEVLPRIGTHRKDQTSATRGRVLIAAMAAGAAAAAAYTVLTPRSVEPTETVLAADETTTTDSGAVITGVGGGMQLVSMAPALNTASHNEELANGAAFAQERAEREARLTRPLFVKPTTGVFTSGFGYRWGALHAGVDLAAPIGTPIYAVSDGTVIEAGPTAGYGAYVKIRHSDGTVTLYGHVNTWTVTAGQQVMAGDQIATVGNRGNSTGPHCHFEVMPDGKSRIDPVPWLAARGISVGSYVG
ncbi:MAG: M23 family metallopeptidase [Mycolicibacterium sp.]|nr:M23 family metallopeptidase [Mycolicibacterium sp.]